MTPSALAPSDGVDAELRQLVSLLLDGALDEGQRRRLEQRLRSEPEAMTYCAHYLRFEALLQEALHPEPLEFEDVRRILFHPRNPASPWTLQHQQTIRRRGARRLRWRLPLLGLVILLSAAAALWWTTSLPTPWHLRNGDFEAMNLARSPHGIGSSILDWQDYFHSSHAALCEIDRISEGKISAKSGRNVVRLNPKGFLTQRLLNHHGEPLKARPGMTVLLRGWSYCEGIPPFPLRASLRFVASSYPEMIQYEPAFATVELTPDGWHAFEIELTLPDDLDMAPSDLNLASSANTIVKKHGRNIVAGEAPPLTANLAGEALTLSIDQNSRGAVVYLDDLSLHVSDASGKTLRE